MGVRAGRQWFLVAGLGLCVACSIDQTEVGPSGVASWGTDGGGSGSDGSTGDDPPPNPTTLDGADGEGGSSDDGAVPLPCDAGFAFTPDPPGSGSITTVGFTFDEPLTYVALTADGPGVAQTGDLEIVGSEPWTWQWPVTGLAPGVWEFSFAHGEPSMTIAHCEIEVLDTGLPPDLPGDPPPPSGDCDPGQVCGDAGPGGGTCDLCPMVGDCLDPPSPYGPGGPGEWSCLDSASCNEGDGVCRIWCPGEPCNEQEHPDGCPQGVEACFVSGSFTSYEEACASCCESRFHEPTGEYACWDPAFNLCRYPTDCGLPLW